MCCVSISSFNLTNSVEQSPPWETDNSSASQITTQFLAEHLLTLQIFLHVFSMAVTGYVTYCLDVFYITSGSILNTCKKSWSVNKCSARNCVVWYYYSFGHNKFSKLYTLFCYTLYLRITFSIGKGVSPLTLWLLVGPFCQWWCRWCISSMIVGRVKPSPVPRCLQHGLPWEQTRPLRWKASDLLPENTERVLLMNPKIQLLELYMWVCPDPSFIICLVGVADV
jgi:hypothetical protein